VSDSGFTPYGRVPCDDLRARLRVVARHLATQGAREVLVACNAASAALRADDEEMHGVWLRGMVPAARRAVASSSAVRVGVIGGLGTISSGLYARALSSLERELRFASAQPLSALVEAGVLDGGEVCDVVSDVLTRLGDVDAILLACTHYPALAPVFRRLAPGVELLDPAVEVLPTIADEGGERLVFATTGDVEASRSAARAAFGVLLDEATALALSLRKA
jgi:glutamate racemase